MAETGAQPNSDGPLGAETLRSHGLQRQPFADIPDDAFLYDDPALDIAVNTLLENLKGANPLLVLIGDPGSGKSTQLLRLISLGASSNLICAFKARSDATFGAIEHTLRQQWGSSAGAGSESTLVDLLCLLGHGGNKPAIVVDDADQLGDHVIRDLLNLRHQVREQCGVAPGLVLAGPVTLPERIERNLDPGVALDPYTVVTQHNLTLEQTEAYLHLRLQAAGARNPDLFSGEIAHAIQEESGGRPFAINNAANERLDDLAGTAARLSTSGTDPGSDSNVQDTVTATPTNARTLTPWAQRWALPLAGGAVAFLGILLVTGVIPNSSRDPTPDNGRPLALPSASPESRVVDLDRRRELAVATPDEWPATDPGAQELEPVAVSRPAPAPGSEADVALTPSPQVSELGRVEDPIDLSEVAPASTTTIAPAPTEAREPLTAETPTDTSESERSAAGGALTDQAGTVQVEPSATEPSSEQTPAAQSVPPVPTVTETRTEPGPPLPRPPAITAVSVEETPSTTASPRVAVQPEIWVRNQASSHFTIQLAGSFDHNKLLEFAESLDLSSPIAIFRSNRDGRTWYTLVTGSYPNSNRARQAARTLPASAQVNQPWVRSFESIQQLLTGD